MNNQESKNKHCISYAPGHNVHWIQAKVKRTEPRYDAVVSTLGPYSLLVRYLNQTETYYHHDVRSITKSLSDVMLGHIKFCPSSLILYLQTEKPDHGHKGVFALYYLSQEKVWNCPDE
jgi:hypothetical protein